MSEPVLQSPLHAFGLAAQAQPIDASKGVWANEIPLLGYINLRGNTGDEAFVDAVSSVLGVRLPAEPCTLAVSADAKVLWLSPDEWMIVCARSRVGSLLGDGAGLERYSQPGGRQLGRLYSGPSARRQRHGCS